MLEHVYEQNQQLIQDQYHLYQNYLIFSSKTSLELFQSPIQFTLTNQQFKINIIIINETTMSNIDKYSTSQQISN